jgi:peptidoglycan/LPS O-acetylase OafA/YrhL
MTDTAATSTTTATLRSNLPALTGLRAVASIAVVATHAAFWTGRYGADTMGLFWARLDFGVALFFALSGFLLFRPWVAALVEQRDRPSTGKYAWNRVLRIIPAYWVAVILAVIFVPTKTGGGLEGFLRHLSLTQIYGANIIRSGITQTWSLAVEAAFYLVLPLLGWLVTRVVCRSQWHPGRILIFLGIICALNFVYFIWIYGHPSISITSRMWPPAYASWFAAGMSLTVIVAAGREGRSWANRALRVVEESPFAVCVMGIALLALASTPIAGQASLYQESAGTAIARNTLYASAAFLLIVTLVTPGHNAIQRALELPVMQWLGKISYELFLVHVMLVELAMNILDYQTFTGSMFLAFSMTMALSIPAAWLLYRIFEAPLRRFHR